MNSTGGSGPPSTTKSGWFNTNILGKPVDALYEDEFLLPGSGNVGAVAEMAVEVDNGHRNIDAASLEISSPAFTEFYQDQGMEEACRGQDMVETDEGGVTAGEPSGDVGKESVTG